jgi:hypothetical protein
VPFALAVYYHAKFKLRIVGIALVRSATATPSYEDLATFFTSPSKIAISQCTILSPLEGQ